MRPYHKFMQPIWIEKEKKIEEFFEKNPYKEYFKCPEIAHGMITGGLPRTFQAQAFHYVNYENHTGLKIQEMRSVIELGGGYGIMAKIAQSVRERSYTIIDIPIINQLQKWVLRNERDIKFQGIDTLENVELNCDMFISVYALSESSAAMIEYVLSKKFFNANHILFGFYKKDGENFQIEKFIPEFLKFGELVDMDPTSSYLVK